jgi:hypothetical protein
MHLPDTKQQEETEEELKEDAKRIPILRRHSLHEGIDTQLKGKDEECDRQELIAHIEALPDAPDDASTVYQTDEYAEQ